MEPIALHVNPPPDPLEGITKAIQLKGMMQGQQLQQLGIQREQMQNQLVQQQMKDHAATTAAYQQWDGKDPDQIPDLVLKNGGSGQAASSVRQQIFQQKKEKMEFDDKTFDLSQKKNDYFLGKLNSVTGSSDEEISKNLMKAAQDAVNDRYLDPQHVAPLADMAKLPPDQLRSQLELFKKGMMGEKRQFDQAQEERKTSAAEWKEVGGVLVNTRTKEEAALGSLMPLPKEVADAAGISEKAGKMMPPKEIKEITDATGAGHQYTQAGGRVWLTDKAGNKIKDMGAATPVVVASFNANPAPAVPTVDKGTGKVLTAGLTQEALDQAAEKYYATGQLPPTSRGPSGVVQNRAIMNRTGELHPGVSLAEGSAEFAANKASLVATQKSFDAVSNFEKTAKKNLDILLSQGKKIVDTGSPFLNTPLRMVDDKMLGSAEVPAYNAARQVAVNEIAKITSNPNLTGQLSDSARHEVESFNPKGATLAQTIHVADILRQDMNNRHVSLQEQIEDIKKRMTGQMAKPAGSSSAPTTPQNPTISPEDRKKRDQSLGVVYPK